mgnify:CR=1 FL=1
MRLAGIFVMAACSTQSGHMASNQSLSSDTESALRSALEDERDAEDTYAAVMTKHGEMRPFANIIHAERRHQQELIALFESYGIEVPKRHAKAIEVPTTIAGACRQAIEAETRNIAMYDKLLAGIEQEDIRQTFLRLQTASRDRHLPAFERCLGRRSE